jgi:hypothetical protein
VTSGSPIKIGIKHLRAFLAAVETAHQHPATEALSIQQSTSRRQITALEEIARRAQAALRRRPAASRTRENGCQFLLHTRRLKSAAPEKAPLPSAPCDPCRTGAYSKATVTVMA